MIKCNSLSVSIQKKAIIKNVSCTFDKGSLTVIIGRNGCGKTTLLRALSGLIPHTGELLIDGKRIESYKRTSLARLISVMPQKLECPHIKVKTLLEYGRAPYANIYGSLSESDRKAIQSAIELTDISALIEKYLDELSGGELRRAYFAMSAATSSSVIMLDEPTANLDATHRKSILELMRSCRDGGKMVISVLHDINDAYEVADNIIAIEGGECVFSGDPDTAKREKLAEGLLSLLPYRAETSDGERITIYR